MEETIWRRAVRLPASLRRSMVVPPRHVPNPQLVRYYTGSSHHAQSIVEVSFWKSLIPKPFRRSEKEHIDWGTPQTRIKEMGAKTESKEWNPATFYIVIFLLIGSMAIQMIALKQDFNTFMRISEARTDVLQEVIEKLQRGEKVDIEKELGTGDVKKEMEWEQALRDIEREDASRILRKKEKTKQSGSATKAEPKTEPKPESKPEETHDVKSSKVKALSSFF